MSQSDLLTAEQFAAGKFELPDAGRWSELVGGEIVTLEPPDDAHGTAVLNLSKKLADYLQSIDDARRGYACFEVGLVVARRPDTVRCPPISYFTEGEPFSELDRTMTEQKPSLVVELASTNERRKAMSDRVEEYLAWGIEMVWVGDPVEKEVHVFRRDDENERASEQDTFSGDPVLGGFRMSVADLFAEPEWWLSGFPQR